MGRRRIAVAVVGAAAVLLAILVRRSSRPDGGMEPPPSASRDESASPTSPASPYDGGAIARTLKDRRVRDELRRRILAQWAAGEELLENGDPPHRPPAPSSTHDDGELDPNYIRSVFREDMWPMARACYEELLARQPDAGGRVEMSFQIIADKQHGGVIDVAEVDAGAPDAIRDDRMNTCVRESLLTLAFRPPPHGGAVTVVYPI
jgi:hypothetical protein